MAVLRATELKRPQIHWTSTKYRSGLREYADALPEAFDLDLRDPVADGRHCFACGCVT